MSHVVRAPLQLVARKQLEEAAKFNGFECIGEGNHKLYSGQHVQGFAIKLPEWDYPVVIDEQGVAHYDNFGGRWGSQIELDKLCQRYAIECAAEQALINGFNLQETRLENGDVELELTQLVTT